MKDQNKKDKKKNTKATEVKVSPIHNTSGGEMPDPDAKHGSSKDEVKSAFKAKKM